MAYRSDHTASDDALRREILAACTRWGDRSRLARAAGITAASMSQFLAGRNGLRRTTAARLRQALVTLSQEPSHDCRHADDPADAVVPAGPGLRRPPRRGGRRPCASPSTRATPAASHGTKTCEQHAAPAPARREGETESPSAPRRRQTASTSRATWRRRCGGPVVTVTPIDTYTGLLLAENGDPLMALLTEDDAASLAIHLLHLANDDSNTIVGRLTLALESANRQIRSLRDALAETKKGTAS